MVRQYRVHANRSIMRPLKALYLSLFVLFFRISRWKGRIKSSTASMCVATVDGIVAVTLWAWIQTATHQYVELNRWIFGGAFAALFVVNHFFLVVRGYGVEFEKEFRSFSKGKRIALYLAAVSVVMVAGITFFIIIEDYHQAFHLPRK